MYSNARAGQQAYQAGQVGSADPLRIIILLYEGAIRFVRQAEQRFQDPAIRGQALGRAHRIITELLTSLDHEEGGEIARNLDGLYRFTLDLITRANVEADVSLLPPVVDVLTKLLEGWTGVERQARELGLLTQR
jgi:flagellar secretion chaperone FliS